MIAWSWGAKPSSPRTSFVNLNMQKEFPLALGSLSVKEMEGSICAKLTWRFNLKSAPIQAASLPRQ